MIFASQIKVSTLLLKNEKFVKIMLPMMLKRGFKHKMKGLKVVSVITLNFGMDGDDFMKNMTTFRMECEAYRSPRFLSKIYVPKRRLRKRFINRLPKKFNQCPKPYFQ
jgi:hypothetical protein